MNPTNLWQFILALPAMFDFFKSMQKRIDDQKLDRKVTDDVQIIHEAFNATDADQLNAIFNSK